MNRPAPVPSSLASPSHQNRRTHPNPPLRPDWMRLEASLASEHRRKANCRCLFRALLPSLCTDGAGGTASKPPDSELPRPAPSPAPSADGAGGTACIPPDSALPRPAPFPAPFADGAGGTTCKPEDNEPRRHSPPRSPAPCADGAGGTTCDPHPENKLARPPEKVPEPCRVGEGGTTALPNPPNVPLAIPETALRVRRQLRAGSPRGDSPILRYPSLRMNQPRWAAVR